MRLAGCAPGLVDQATHSQPPSSLTTGAGFRQLARMCPGCPSPQGDSSGSESASWAGQCRLPATQVASLHLATECPCAACPRLTSAAQWRRLKALERSGTRLSHDNSWEHLSTDPGLRSSQGPRLQVQAWGSNGTSSGLPYKATLKVLQKLRAYIREPLFGVPRAGGRREVGPV